MTGNQKQKGNIWQSIQDRLAESNGLAIVIATEDSPELAKSNNNSVCQVLYNSQEFAPKCAKFCGRAFEMATEAEKPVGYKCHAGLNCLAVPVKTETKQFVAIVGRTFLKAEDYRNATTRAISGDWQKFPPTKFFENVLLSSSTKNLETVARQLEKLSAAEKEALIQIVESLPTVEELSLSEKSATENKVFEKSSGETPQVHAQEVELTDLLELTPVSEIEIADESFQNSVESSPNISEKLSRQNSEEAEKMSKWRSLLSSLLDLSYLQACEAVSQFIARRYSISSLAWLERKGNQLEPVFAAGKLHERKTHLNVSANDTRLLDAVKNETHLEILGDQTGDGSNTAQITYLFPIAVSDDVKSALVIADDVLTENNKRHISRFCQTVSNQLEILRLREQLSRRVRLERAVQKFNASTRDIDTDDFWASLARITAELMRAERSSVLVFDEKMDFLTAKAATSAQSDIIKKETKTLGERVALEVLKTGKPLIVEDVRKIKIFAAPVEHHYKSNSFICYPIIIGKRKIGVLNITDRADGETFSELDLEILDAIMPQIAVLIDRALLKHKAGEFEQLSVTDSLTGLLNRRYLEERLAEEIKRSRRDGFQMSFMMIDVDHFKSYNDNFSHPEGDKALKIVATCLKESLRSSDVAARYGGEEFSILLPQTTLNESRTIAERIREKVLASEFPHRQVTISVGVVTCSDTICTAQSVIKAADDALYEAKRRGRNNVQFHEDL